MNCLTLTPRQERPVEHFTLDASKEAFAGGIVRGTSFPGHGTDQCTYQPAGASPASGNEHLGCVQHRPVTGTERGRWVVNTMHQSNR